MKRRSFLVPLILSGVYILIGTYNYFSNGKVSHFFDDLKTDLAYTIVRPSEIFGIMARFVGSYIYDSDLFFVLGQLVGLMMYTSLLLLLIIIVKALLRKIKS